MSENAALAKWALDELIDIREGKPSNARERVANLARAIRPDNIMCTKYDPVSRRVTTTFVDGSRHTSDIDVSQECFDNFIKDPR